MFPHPSALPTKCTQVLNKKIPWMGLVFLEAALIQTVFPYTFLICTTVTLSPFTVSGGLDWAGPAQVVEPLILEPLVLAFAKCRSRCLKVPLPTAFNVVFGSPLHCSIFTETGA